MNKTLIILAHPNSVDSFNGAISIALKNRYLKQGLVEFIDLYESEWNQDWYKPGNKEITSVQKKIQELISWSNHIIFVHPLWWGWATRQA